MYLEKQVDYNFGKLKEVTLDFCVALPVYRLRSLLSAGISGVVTIG